MPAINSAEARDATYHLHPYTNLRQLERDGPLAIDRGEGVFVVDTQGNRYLEGMAGLWCTSLGFSEPRLAEAAYRQLKTLPFYHSFAAKVASITTELAERLIGIAPKPLARVIFACSGSESNDTAIKMVWYYNNARGKTAKKKIISRRRGYHGVTALTAAGVHVGLPRILPAGTQRAIGNVMRNMRDRSPVQRGLTLGLLTPLLPCGWLYAFVMTAAATGSAPRGAFVMAVFWAGTVPAMAALGLGVQRALGPFRTKLPAVTAAAMMVIGLLTVVGKFTPSVHAHQPDITTSAANGHDHSH